MENFFQDQMSKLMEQLAQKKEQILKMKLEQNGIVIDFEKEAKRRFKTIKMEQHHNQESYYYDNGTEDGLRIVTFQMITPELLDVEEDYSMGISLKYY